MTYKESIYKDVCELVVDFEEGYYDSVIKLGGDFSISLCGNTDDFQDWEIVLRKRYRKVNSFRLLNCYGVLDLLTGERDFIEEVTNELLNTIKRFIPIKDEEEMSW